MKNRKSLTKIPDFVFDDIEGFYSEFNKYWLDIEQKYIVCQNIWDIIREMDNITGLTKEELKVLSIKLNNEIYQRCVNKKYKIPFPKKAFNWIARASGNEWMIR